ncbi:sensor domain-containing diguanylate cyclase [Thalassobaculum salexigens]|uniref:sensor domain-containing diguanylate cyclase n=1 Tax=Thalassobaculum salexigens TaxID=455360 RepID=UPI00040EBA55|nr:diguanylate cyclase [Thalassobaculum salexigens]
MPIRLFLLLICLCGALGVWARPALSQAGSPHAVPTIALSTIGDGIELINHALILRDPGAVLDLDQALTSRDWQWLGPDRRNAGITDDLFWIRFRLRNDTGTAQEVVASYDIANLTAFTAYVRAPDGSLTRTDVDPGLPYDQRAVASPLPAVSILLPAGEERDVTVAFGNAFPVPMNTDINLWSAAGFDRHTLLLTTFIVFLVGCLTTAAAFWLLYGAFMRQGRMVVYALYMTGLVAVYLSFTGVGEQILFPSTVWLRGLGFHWAMFCVGAACLEFARRHLDIARLHPGHDRFMRLGAAACLCMAVVSFPSRYPEIEAPLTFVAMTGAPLYVTWRSWIAWRRDGISYASWMVIGWGGVTASSVMGVFGSELNLPYLDLSQAEFTRLVFACTVVESLLFSASLGQWLRGQEVRRIAAEAEASRDSLTGLLNRRGFDAQVLHLKQAGLWPGRLWLALIDLDRFKEINDTYSHAAGDAVLTHFATMLRREFRANDVTVRFGGEEFILLFEAESEEAACSAVDRVRRRFAGTPTRYEGSMIGHTLSAGLVPVADGPDGDEATLIAMADAALYGAKKAGRNIVRASSELTDPEIAQRPAPGGSAELSPLIETATARN